MRIVGETILLVTREGGGVDDRGYPLPEKVVNVEIDGAVFIPESTGRITDGGRVIEFEQARVLLPRFEEIAAGAEIHVRGERFFVERGSVDHRSAFGTSRGGTEIFLKKVTG